jgi:hypothetical protein
MSYSQLWGHLHFDYMTLGKFLHRKSRNWTGRNNIWPLIMRNKIPSSYPFPNKWNYLGSKGRNLRISLTAPSHHPPILPVTKAILLSIPWELLSPPSPWCSHPSAGHMPVSSVSLQPSNPLPPHLQSSFLKSRSDHHSRTFPVRSISCWHL